MEHRTISLDDMRMFATVVQTKSITAAASILGCSKQTVSRRLSALEHRLGEPLLHRSTREIKPTRLGASYAERCRAVTEMALGANQQFARDVEGGRIRVTADRVLGEALLPDVVVRFAESHANVSIELSLTSQKLDLAREEVDVAIRVGGDAVPEGYREFDLGPAEVCFCASPDYLQRRGAPETPTDLLHHECIHGEGTSVDWPFLSAQGQVEKVTVNARYRLGSFPAVKAAVLSGLGIAMLPAFACGQYLEGGTLHPLLDDWAGPVGSIRLLCRETGEPNPALPSFIGAVKSVYKGLNLSA